MKGHLQLNNLFNRCLIQLQRTEVEYYGTVRIHITEVLLVNAERRSQPASPVLHGCVTVPLIIYFTGHVTSERAEDILYVL